MSARPVVEHPRSSIPGASQGRRWVQSRSEFKKAFITRVREARDASPYNQRQMAELLGTSTANYEKYETRSCLPHHLIGRFALAVGVTVAFLLTGREEEKPRRPESIGQRGARRGVGK